eukprot:COSAG02_NODE_4129_length_5740_cov_11.843290_2_plen_185_part_00
MAREAYTTLETKKAWHFWRPARRVQHVGELRVGRLFGRPRDATMTAQLGAACGHAPSGLAGVFGAPHRRPVIIKLPPIRIDLAVAERDRMMAHQASSAHGLRPGAPLNTPRPVRHVPNSPATEYGGGFLSPRVPRVPRAPYAPPPRTSASGTARRATDRRQPRSSARKIRVPSSASAARPGTGF